MSETTEKTYFDHNGIQVTNARFIVPSQTYAMSGITSVKFFTESPSKLWPITAMLIGALALSNNGNIWSIAIPVAIGILLLQRKSTHHVILSSASGETRALNSKNKEFIYSVIAALNQSIVARG
jgi:ABC-type Fe3+-siderophore transport system permease subunit